jgi:SAM-dependent methyltransferase
LRSKDLNDPAKVENTNVPRVAEESEDTPPILKNTGERFLPGTMGSAEIAYDHIARYRLAERYVKDRETVDLGCGAGYGTHSLSKFTRSIVGVDLSSEAVAYANWSYETPGLRYEVGDVTDVPYEDGSFEAAVSFEVIEHLERPEDLVEEARRLLKDDGVFVTSTPDKQTYSNDRNSVNPHHLKEMYPLAFREILERNFRHVQLYRQGALAGSIITPDPEKLPEDERASLESTRFSLPDPAFGHEVPTTLYMIAVCTNGVAPEPLRRPLLILDRDRQIYEEHAQWHAILGQLLTYHNYNDRRLKGQLLVKSQRLQETNQRLQEKSQRLQQTNQRLERQDRLLQGSQRELNAMRNSRGWKIANKINVATSGLRRILRRGR